jgi:protein subunit release factor A
MERLFSITKKDLQVTYFSGKGKGGQHRNRHMNCVRLKHLESGITVTGQSNKERKSNIKEALNNLVKHPKFKMWLNSKIVEIDEGKRIEEKVEEMIKPENLKFETVKDGKWSE